MIEFNNSQRLGLDLDRHIALDAGAGTGKTTVMAERYVQHLIASEQRAAHVTPHGPRTPLQGHGALRAPKRERTDMKEWPGLLPSETVAITFTRKSAAELKARIRHRLSLTRALPPTEDDTDGVFDPRLRNEGDVEMLLSGLDEAPISTIDAFLSQLVQPYIDLVALYPSNQQVSEERKPIMVQDTLHAVWRIRSVEDAREAGVLNHHHAFLEARNRLVRRLGGQDHAEVVLGGLLDRSLFVEQSHRSMIQRAEAMGLPWSGRGPAPVEVLLNTIAEPVEGLLPDFTANLHMYLTAWIQEFLPYRAQCIAPAEAEEPLTRFNHLTRLMSQPVPTQPGEQLTWVWKALLGIATASGLVKPTCSFFPRDLLPNGDGWPSGLLSKSRTKGIGKDEKEDLYGRAINRLRPLRDHLNSANGRLIRLLARSAFLLNPGDGFDGMPLDSPLRLDPLDDPMPAEPSDRGMYVSATLQTQVLSDLLVIHTACNQILARRKSLDNMHDFDDMQRFAADLLLARCPDICRHRYPPEVIDALDSLGDEPWSDAHISRALTLLNDRPALQEDLHRRFSILGELRRQYRAFIIDEYQDTNPSHYRLLARLWGRRRHHSDDPARPLGAWDPTVCIVGDMKQSIYRFRQAEVSVMRRAVAAIRQFNVDESSEPRLNHLRLAGHGRDPRPVGGGGETGSFSNEHSGEQSAPHTFVPFAEEDVSGLPSISDERLERRLEGHVDLTSNHRTQHALMETMNDIFDEVFAPRYHDLPGDWHAEPQRLRPARSSPSPGELEWLLPIAGAIGEVPTDLDVAVNTFQDPSASSVHLEHELLADRLHALFHQTTTRVWDSEHAQWTALAPDEGPPVRPQDVMILINSRKHLPDLVERLRARNIPVLADRQGLLLMQPVIQPLMAVLGLMARPSMRKAGVELARSPVVGMTEQHVHEVFLSLEGGQAVLPHLVDHAPTPRVQELLRRLQQYISWGAVYDVFDLILDESDLLVAYPEDAQRQFAEAWLTIVQGIGKDTGHDASEMYRRMVAVRNLGNQGPQAITQPTSSAVQIMTIHGSKGLQAPVVVVTGLFSAGKADASMSVQDNILVTPQVLAGRIQPWKAKERPQDGLWAFTAEMNKAQDKAELRRKFYVALTRVKDRLILTGAPGNKASFNETTGLLSVRFAPDPRTMGRMLVEGLRRASWNAQTPAPWLSADEVEKDMLPLFSSNATETPFNPTSLLDRSPLGINGLAGLRVYHHPSCFETMTTHSPQQRVRALATHLERLGEASVEDATPLLLEENIKGAAHHLDATSSCARKYWLEHVKGWATEPFMLPNTSTKLPSLRPWPEPTTFGLMMHRVLEIGLRNPRAQRESTPTLEPSWMHESDDDLASSSTVGRVMNEFGYGLEQKPSSREATWRDRLMHLSALTDAGLLGRWVRGEEVNGWSVEAVRTELPFFHREVLARKESVEPPFRHTNGAVVHRVNMDFSGRADLVLALVDEQGAGALQVVDLKTRGCLAAFNEDEPQRGHPLQQVPPSEVSTVPQSDEEADILNEHRLQLTLYSMALEAIEARKPEAERRRVLPPALLLGANGRIVALSQGAFDRAKEDLRAHLDWRATVHLDALIEEPERLESGSETCRQCPFYRGDLRRCGPKGEPLGFVAHLNDEP
ncbi:MAG: UvrD-helicase domain-containing protein [Candidatus Poseidoniales archaeon]